MIKKHIFGGCNRKLRTSCEYNERIYFCLSSNILISDKTEVKEVIFLQNYLNFVTPVTSEFLISGDSTGNLYIIRKNKDIKKNEWKVEKIKFEEALQDAFYVEKDLVICVVLQKLIVYDLNKKKITAEIQTDFLISASFVFLDFIFLGSVSGNLYVYDLCLNIIDKILAHNDRIQDINCTMFSDTIHVATSSKDHTIKIWKNTDSKYVHKQTLTGHSDWVYQINWYSFNNLVSASADKSIMTWEYNTEMLWECTSVLGGASPFLNAFVLNNKVIGQSQTGSFYKFDECITDFISGHLDSITSIDWNDDYILSTSLDKTARIFYGNREIGRPLSHGFEIMAGRFLSNDNMSIIIGAQETIIRVLDPTYVFYLSCECIKEKKTNVSECSQKNYFQNLNDLKFAAVPAELSLTSDILNDYDFENINEYLLSTTSFAEQKKIYGHYFDISDIAVSKNFIVSCNKSLTKKFGGIFLWDKNYKLIDYLEVHSYGINKLSISQDEKYLCAVSKDKTSSIYTLGETLELKYRNYEHNRVVWDCAFSFNSRFYATCSRDRKVCVYDLFANNKCVNVILLDCEATAVEFSQDSNVLYIGTENGEICSAVYNKEVFVMSNQDTKVIHSQRINVIKISNNGKYLATGGKDGLINVFELKLHSYDSCAL